MEDLARLRDQVSRSCVGGGNLPDVEVVAWESRGDHVVARLRQPAFGDDADWFQVLSVRDGVIASLEDHPTRESALAALGG